MLILVCFISKACVIAVGKVFCKLMGFFFTFFVCLNTHIKNMTASEFRDTGKCYNIMKSELVAKQTPEDSLNYCRFWVTENLVTGSGILSLTSTGLTVRILSGSGVTSWCEVGG